MKKNICRLLSLALIITMFSLSNVTVSAKSSGKTDDKVEKMVRSTQTDADMTGGWNAAKSSKITKKRKKLFRKALNGLMGVDYKPVAYLGSQLVAGTNHCFLSKAQVVYPGSEPYYVLVYIYENLEGKAEVTNILKLDIGALSEIQ